MSDELRDLRKQFEMLQAAFSKAAGDHVTISFGEYAKRYQEQKLKSTGLRESTKRSFEYNVRAWLLPAFSEIPLDKLGNADWNAWITSTQSVEHRRITRYFNARKALIEILNAAKKEGLIDRIPSLDNPDEPKNVGRVLEEIEIWLILRHTTYPIFRLFFWVLYKMGCRPREILQWEWSMFTWAEPGHTWLQVPARISKTGRTRPIAINPSVSAHLHRILRRGVTSRFVFPNRIHVDKPQLSYHGAWRTACTKAGVKAAVPYDNRRTFITNAVAKNKPSVFLGKQLDTSAKQIEGTYAKKQVEVMEDIVSD